MCQSQPYTTMLRVGAGHPTVFTRNEEGEIVATVQALKEIGFGPTKELVDVVRPFHDEKSGGTFFFFFFEHWKSKLSVSKPQNLPTNKTVSASEVVLNAWFERVDELFKKTGLDFLVLYNWNCDETGFCTAVSAKKILAR